MPFSELMWLYFVSEYSVGHKFIFHTLIIQGNYITNLTQCLPMTSQNKMPGSYAVIMHVFLFQNSWSPTAQCDTYDMYWPVCVILKGLDVLVSYRWPSNHHAHSNVIKLSYMVHQLHVDAIANILHIWFIHRSSKFCSICLWLHFPTFCKSPHVCSVKLKWNMLTVNENTISPGTNLAMTRDKWRTWYSPCRYRA